ncbi:MAG TPA: class I tRNA ligase family protein [Opitutales bacterium]|nr:class I tRNA ligase family protein [Opitutales bacterium]
MAVYTRCGAPPMKPFYITTAIDYANGSPHLGHAYEKVLADVIARTQRLRGTPVHFLTGLDEHGTKVQQSAKARGIEPQALCDAVAAEFQALLQTLGISNDDYVRTTEPRHKDVVRAVLQKLYDQGDIYLGEYRGFYSARQEQFLQEKDKVNGQWPELYGDAVEVVEKNYFFKLARHQDWLIQFLNENPGWIFPAFRQKQVVEFLKEPLNDLCISRPRERLEWGIPLPFDEKYVTYVWFDALVNYISAVGYGKPDFAKTWPADAHVIGKDILVPPHAVYWPIMLKVSGIPLPKKLLVHGFVLFGGKKESKTEIEKAKAAGLKVESALDVLLPRGPETLRYFLLREVAVGQDSDFSYEQFNARYNSELADDLGNGVARLLNMGARYAGGVVPAATVNEEPERTLQAEWEKFAPEIYPLCDGFQFHLLLEKLNVFVKAINRYLDVRSPWKLAKSADAADQARVATSLAYLAESVRLAAVTLAPIMPETSAKILGLLGQPPVAKWEGSLTWGASLAGAKLGEKVILFPKLETEKKA